MARFVKGDVVVIPFPFSDLSETKRRPALVLADFPGDDILLCQITSKYSAPVYVVELNAAGFTSGSLPCSSFIRTNRIFTGDKNMIIRKTGHVSSEIMSAVVDRIITYLK